MEDKVVLKNPITGYPVDEVISEKEARKRGFNDLQFRLKYLEDDNEFVEYYVIDEKKIIVEREKPYLNYKKKTGINHERVLGAVTTNEVRNTVEPAVCSIDDPDCLSCGS